MENKKDYIKKISNALVNLIKNDILSDKDAGLNDASIKHEYTIKNILNIVYDLKIINTNDIKSNYPGIDLIDEENKKVYQISSQKDKKNKVDYTIEQINKYDLINKYNISDIEIIFLTDKKVSFNKYSKEPWEQWANSNKVTLNYYNLDKFKAKIIKKLQQEHNDNKIHSLLQYLLLNDNKDFLTFEISKFYNNLYKSLQDFTTSNFIGFKNEVEKFMSSDNKILLIRAVQGHGKTHFINYLAKNSNFNGHIPILLTNSFCTKEILNDFITELNFVIILDDIDRYNKNFIGYLINGIQGLNNIKLIFTCREVYEINIQDYNNLINYETLNIKWEEKHIDELIDKYREKNKNIKLDYFDIKKIKTETKSNPFFLLFSLNNNLVDINDCEKKYYDDIIQLINNKLHIYDKVVINKYLVHIGLNIPFNINNIQILDYNEESILNILFDNNLMYKEYGTYRYTYDIVGDLILAYIIEKNMYLESIFRDTLNTYSYVNILNFTYSLEYIDKKTIYNIERIIIENFNYKNIDDNFISLYFPITQYLPNFAYKILSKIEYNKMSIYMLSQYINRLIFHIQKQIYKISFSINDITQLIIQIYKTFKYTNELIDIITIDNDNNLETSVFYHLTLNLFNICKYNSISNDYIETYSNYINQLISLDIPKHDINTLENNLLINIYNMQYDNNYNNDSNDKFSSKFFSFLHQNYYNRNNDKYGTIAYLYILLNYPYLTSSKQKDYIVHILQQYEFNFKEQRKIENLIISSLVKYNKNTLKEIDDLISILDIFMRQPLYIFYCFINNDYSAYLLEEKLHTYKNLGYNDKLNFIDELYYSTYSYNKNYIPYKTNSIDEYFEYIKNQNNIIDFIVSLDENYYYNIDKFIEQFDDLAICLYTKYNEIKSDFIKKIVLSTYFRNKSIYISNAKILFCNDKNILFALINTINHQNINNLYFYLIIKKILKLDITLFDFFISQINQNIEYITKNTAKNIINAIIIFIKKTNLECITSSIHLSHLITNFIQKNYNINKLKKFIIRYIMKVISMYDASSYIIKNILDNINFSYYEKELIFNKILKNFSKDCYYTKVESLYAISGLINNQDSFNLFIKIFLKYRKQNKNIKIQTYNILHYSLPYFNRFNIYSSDINTTYYDNFLIKIKEDTNLCIEFLQVFIKYCSPNTVGTILDYLYEKVDNDIFIDIFRNNNEAIVIYEPNNDSIYLSSLESVVTNKDLLDLINKVKNELKSNINTIDNIENDRYSIIRTPYGAKQ